MKGQGRLPSGLAHSFLDRVGAWLQRGMKLGSQGKLRTFPFGCRTWPVKVRTQDEYTKAAR